MVSISTLKDWTPQQIQAGREASPAIDRYVRILDSNVKAHNLKFADTVRMNRHSAWVNAALSTFHKTQSPEVVCKEWSEVTVQILSQIWLEHGLDKENICLIAMGKLGAFELNLSSDIDIFFVSDDDPEKEMLKKVRRFLNDVSEVRASGFCYRVDLDLRPGGSASPLVISFDTMTNHYGYQGETWERVALIRQSIPLGPKALKEKILSFCQKYAFRKHIDLTLFHDLYGMRKKIQHHKFNTSELNLKFRKGGIRDLELLVHALQLIHGGKNKLLISGSMTVALNELATAKHLDAADCETLRDSYWFFRQIENLLHAENDQHTYDLAPSTLVSAEQKNEFLSCAHRIATIVDQFLKPYHQPQTNIANLDAEFKALNLNEDSLQAWSELLQTKIQSRSKLRDEHERQLFFKNVLLQLKTLAVDPALTLKHLQQFLLAIKAKTSFFTLFNQNPTLLEEMLWIFSCSPFLSQILIHRPELVDSFLLKNVSLDANDEDQFYSSAQDYKLLSDLIHSSRFLKHRDSQQLTAHLSKTANTIVETLLKILCEKFKVHIQVLALGKWASGEMGLTSDLDFIFITNEELTEAHFKAARRFIHFLNSPHSGQTLYHIDLRLRPSGSAGPLLLSVDDLKKYLNEKAEAWERQAYLCHRFLPSTPPVPLFSPCPLSSQDKLQLKDIQNKLLIDSPTSLDLKKNHGGLLHTELTLQLAALDAGVFPTSPNVHGLCHALQDHHPAELCAQIETNYVNLRSHQQLLILISQSAKPRIEVDSHEIDKISAVLQTSPKVLLQTLKDLLLAQKSLLNKLDPLRAQLKIEE